MKKILFFHHYNSPVGAGLSFLHILQSIDKSAYDLVVCIPPIEGVLDKKIKSLGIRVIYSDAVVPYMHFSGGNLPYLSIRNLKNSGQILKAKSDLAKVIERENPDCVAINSLTLYWIGKIAKGLRKKTICFHRETYDRGLIGVRTARMKKHFSTYFDGIAFLSYFDMNETPVGKGKYVRITDKVDVSAYEKLLKTDCREKLNLPRDGKLVLYLGGKSSLKGPLVAIKAMKWVDEAKLVFLQYQPEKLDNVKARIKYAVKILLNRNLDYKIARQIEKKNLRERILFRPATDCVEEYFTACDAVVFPSMQPHQSRPIYEAGIAKKPIAITDFVNTREFLDEMNGWMFPKGNAKVLAHRIEEMFSIKSAQRVEENYQRALSINNLHTLPSELQGFMETVMGEMK